MKTVQLLLYIMFLLNKYENGFMNPVEEGELLIHLLEIYAWYLSLKEADGSVKKRKWWVRPIFEVERRKAQGASDNLIFEMSYRDREKYLEYLRMTKEDFNELLRKVRPLIRKQNAVREPIPPHTRLHISLRYLASGDSMHSIAFAFRVALNTIAKIVPETCKAIWKVLKQTAFPTLTTRLWCEHAQHFEQRWNFHRCIGAVDGKQVIMQAPKNSGSSFFNYKHNFGMNLMAIADAHYRFIVVDIGAPGRRSDGGVFKESQMGRRFESRSLKVPLPNAVCENGPDLPYVLLGDEAFALSDYLMRPYPRSGILDIIKKVFNYRLSRARRVVESAFGILGARAIIQATTCLHNWLITKSLKNNSNQYHSQLYSHLTAIERDLAINGLKNITWRNHENLGNRHSAVSIRDKFAQFFMNVGAIPCQWDKASNNDF